MCVVVILLCCADYNPYKGAQRCEECSEGMLCDNVGIVVPCVAKNYWRYGATSPGRTALYCAAQLVDISEISVKVSCHDHSRAAVS